MDLSNQSAIVTGGASGLGHATARRLAEAGAAVVVVDLPDREGETLRADAVAALGPRARLVTGDVTAEATSTDHAREHNHGQGQHDDLVNTGHHRRHS